MQMAIVAAAVSGVDELPKSTGGAVPNPLVNSYETSDGRWIALCMLQPDAYWGPFTRHIGRADLADDERFATGPDLSAHSAAAVAELSKTFVQKTLAEWRPILAAQRGQWDVVNTLGDVLRDEQAIANGFVQHVDYGEQGTLPLVASPVLFDGRAPDLVPAPDFAADTDPLLLELGREWDEIVELKITEAVF
jgi:crotonobetainyl-CoA:carnitine CoA-transferase CaiB-like acyl-CoA transferase